jgi:hypothetical protein
MEEENKYGKCLWNNENKINERGSNCPEYYILHFFFEGYFR